MKCVKKGHGYKLRNRYPDNKGPTDTKFKMEDQQLVFINLQPGQMHAGTTTQEVLRVLIDRTRHCANCMPHPNNERIVYHLRMALALHEARALERRIEKEGLAVEMLPVTEHGHLSLPNGDDSGMPACEGVLTPKLDPHPLDGAKVPNHPSQAPVTA